MSQRDHNALLSALHVAWGCLHLLALSAVGGGGGVGVSAVVFELYGYVLAALGPGAAEWRHVVFFLVFFLLLSFPSLAAGYGMMKRRPWARGAAVVAAIMASLSPPLGTALCVYTLWFVFGEGRQFYGQDQSVSG